MTGTEEWPILRGKWGGDWEYLYSRRIRQDSPNLLRKVRSVKTGYVTEMREDSFLNNPPEGYESHTSPVEARR